jgi:hypothetical protein
VRTQANQILDYLATGRPLTALTALNRFGSLRLAARVHQLREAGHRIASKRVTKAGKSFSEYRLAR